MNGERKKRRLRPWMIVLGLLAALLAYMYWPAGPVPIVISRETTYIDRPLNADDTPNYVAYLNQRYSNGVTAENNAAPLLLRAFGPDMMQEETQAETLNVLHLPADLLDQDKHFVLWPRRTRVVKAGTTLPTQADGNDAPPGEDEDGPSLDDVRKMLLAGQIHPDLDAWLAENADPLDLIRQAADKEKLYLPLVSRLTPPSLLDTPLIYFRGLRDAVESLTLRAMRKAAKNDLPGAWDDVLAARKLARLVGRHPTLVGRLVAGMMESLAAKTGIDLATRYPLPADLARTILARLAALAPAGDMADLIDQGERFFTLDATMMLSRGKSLGYLTGESGQSGGDLGLANAALALDWNQALREMNSWYDRMIKPLRIPFSQGRPAATKAFAEEFKKTVTETGGLKLLLLRFGGRPCRSALTSAVTDLLMAILMPSLEYAVTTDDRTKAAGEIEIVAVALAGFRAETGRWPAELKELCPSLLKEIPPDRFSGKPLIYKPGGSGYLVYSIGDNLRDDGGQWDPDSRGGEKKDDIAAEVKPADANSKPAEATSKPAATMPAAPASKPAASQP